MLSDAAKSWWRETNPPTSLFSASAFPGTFHFIQQSSQCASSVLSPLWARLGALEMKGGHVCLEGQSVCVWGCAERPVNLARVEREERIIRMSGESGRSALILALSAWSSRCAPYPLPPTAPGRTPCLSLSLTTAPRVLSGRLPSSTSSSSTRVTPAPPQLSAQWPLLREASPTFPGRPLTAPVINPAWRESSMK